MKVTKVTLSLTAYDGTRWIKPGVEIESTEMGETAKSILTDAKNALEDWLSVNYPGAQLSGEPEELPIIQQNRG